MGAKLSGRTNAVTLWRLERTRERILMLSSSTPVDVVSTGGLDHDLIF
jgi:hypothetical protein